MSKINIGEAVRAAWMFWRTHTREAAGVLSLATAGGILSSWGGMMAIPAALTLGSFVNFAGAVMGGCALMRLALADRHPSDAAFVPGRAGYQWTRQEWRAIGATCAGIIALIVPWLAIGFTGVGVYNLVAGPPPQGGGLSPVGVISVFLGLAIGGYLAMRVFLAPIASLDHKRFTLAWSLTKGHVWSILLAYLATVGPLLLFYMVANAIIRSIPPTQVGIAASLAGFAVVGLSAEFVQIPVTIGVLAHLYRALAPPADPA